MKMATAMVSCGPIIFLYPFVQKYFIGGITVGAVKGGFIQGDNSTQKEFTYKNYLNFKGGCKHEQTQ